MKHRRPIVALAILVILFACLGCHRAAKHPPFHRLLGQGQDVTDPKYLESRFRILANDDAGADQWLSASSTIALAAHVNRMREELGQPLELSVEKLRAHTNPSVTELISQRIRELGDDDSLQAVHAVCWLSVNLANWDLAGALPVIREQMTRSLAHWRGKQDDEHESQRLAGCIAFFTVARMEAGDTVAVDEYADWIVDTTPLTATHESFPPLWLYPESPAVDKATKALFSDPKSSWLPLMLPVGNDGLPVSYNGILDTPLVDHPVVRRQLVIELTLDHPIAEFRIRRGPQIEVKRELGTVSSISWPRIDPEDPIRPRIGAHGEVRYCDFLAMKLSSAFEELAFGVHWPLPQRQAALVELDARLRDDAPLFVEDPHCDTSLLICEFEELGEDASTPVKPAAAGG